MEYKKIVCYIQKIFRPVEEKYGFDIKITNNLSCVVYSNQCYKVMIYIGREIEFQIKWVKNRPHIILDDYQIAESIKKEYRGMISDDKSIHFVVALMVKIITSFFVSYYGDEDTMRALKCFYDEKEVVLEKEEIDGNLSVEMDLLWKEGRYSDFLAVYKKLEGKPTKLLQKKYEYAKKHFKN